MKESEVPGGIRTPSGKGLSSLLQACIKVSKYHIVRTAVIPPVRISSPCYFPAITNWISMNVCDQLHVRLGSSNIRIVSLLFFFCNWNFTKLNGGDIHAPHYAPLLASSYTK